MNNACHKKKLFIKNIKNIKNDELSKKQLYDYNLPYNFIL